MIYNTQEIEDMLSVFIGVMSDTGVKRIRVELVVVFEKGKAVIETARTINIDKEVAGINFG